MKLFKLLFCIICYTNCFSQDTSVIISKYQIHSSIHGKNDESKFDQNRQGYLLIHYDKFNNLNLTNISFDSGSYSTGTIHLVSDSTKSDGSIQKIYKWDFRNSYDKAKGTIIFKLTEKRTAYGIEFTFNGKLMDSTILFYKGYKEADSQTYIIPETIFR